ncbi:MAG: hypothetical protein ACLQUY_23025 [Ktedonobacterales bacterium]
MSSADIAASYANLVDRLCELAFAYYRDGRLRDASRVLRSGEELIENAADGDVREYDHARLALAHGFVLVQDTFYRGRRGKPCGLIPGMNTPHG